MEDLQRQINDLRKEIERLKTPRIDFIRTAPALSAGSTQVNIDVTGEAQSISVEIPTLTFDLAGEIEINGKYYYLPLKNR